MKDVRLGSEIDDNITELSTLIDHTAQTNADPQHKAAVPAVQASETTKAAMAGSADAEVSLLLTYRCLCVCLQRDCLCVCLQRDWLRSFVCKETVCVHLQKDWFCIYVYEMPVLGSIVWLMEKLTVSIALKFHTQIPHDCHWLYIQITVQKLPACQHTIDNVSQSILSPRSYYTQYFYWLCD